MNEPHSASPTAKSSITILLVDDEPTVTLVWEAALTELGYHVLVADSGETALKVWQQHYVHLLITDVMMDHPNGVDLARQLTSRQPSLKVIFMSGAQRETLARLLPVGANLVAKPTTISELRDRVAQVLAGA